MNTKFEKVPSKDALSIESTILEHFKGMTNPKKIVKLANKLLNEVDSEVGKLLCIGLIKAKDPYEKLKRNVALIEDAAVIIEDFIEQGFHGMIILKDNVYPVEVKTIKSWLSSKDKWTEEDEIEIQYKVAEDWLRTNNKTEFLGKVVLFPNFGFSGVPRLVEVGLG